MGSPAAQQGEPAAPPQSAQCLRAYWLVRSHLIVTEITNAVPQGTWTRAGVPGMGFSPWNGLFPSLLSFP